MVEIFAFPLTDERRSQEATFLPQELIDAGWENHNQHAIEN